jgi:hypothetical protein
LDRQGDSFLKTVFDKFADSSSSTATEAINEDLCDFVRGCKSRIERFVSIDVLQGALLELGVYVEWQKVEELIVLMDLDENSGLDFEEFKRALQQQPTQLEQWAGRLLLAGMLARSIPVSDSQGDQPLRDFSRLDEAAINTILEAFSDGLQRLLIEAQASARQMYKGTGTEAAKNSASGASTVLKFKTFKISTGTVQNDHKGLADRIGTFHFLDHDA